MIRSKRMLHRRMWMVLALFIPVLLILAFKARTFTPRQPIQTLGKPLLTLQNKMPVSPSPEGVTCFLGSFEGQLFLECIWNDQKPQADITVYQSSQSTLNLETNSYLLGVLEPGTVFLPIVNEEKKFFHFYSLGRKATLAIAEVK